MVTTKAHKAYVKINVETKWLKDVMTWWVSHVISRKHALKQHHSKQHVCEIGMIHLQTV